MMDFVLEFAFVPNIYIVITPVFSFTGIFFT